MINITGDIIEARPKITRCELQRAAARADFRKGFEQCVAEAKGNATWDYWKGYTLEQLCQALAHNGVRVIFRPSDASEKYVVTDALLEAANELR